MKKLFLGLVACSLMGIVFAHAQVNPQDQINALNLRIEKDLDQWTADNSAKKRDWENMHDQDIDINALNQEIIISQTSINIIENNVDNNIDNQDI